MSDTYEQLRNSVENSEARAAWMDHDRRQHRLTQTYRSLKDDPRYSGSHKAEQMWAAYEREGEHIQAAGEKARELLERDARGHEMRAMPRPKGENVTNLSAERLSLAQAEAARIVRKTQRLQNASYAGPFNQSTADVLREEYARGIESGGVEGVAICKGTLMAADELGISEEEFLDSLRTSEQLEALDKARRARMMAQSISKRIPTPPLRRPVDSTPGPGRLFIPRGRQQHTVNPVSHWIRR
jgi:hypothetical protein